MHDESTDGRLRLVTAERSGTPLLVLTGESDHEAVGALDRALAEAARRDGADVRLDLSGVRFADSSLANSLLRGRVALGGRLLLLDPSAPVVRLLDVLGLRDLFAVHAGSRPRG
ncbi:STAS domain-containing protein [Streptomyces sp. NPDC060194]|uniref:STAS domain-containing protein n=1 Tax=Streptomyces sp. NPDC060194 TaxID=3347069 RepID=UPI00364686FF